MSKPIAIIAGEPNSISSEIIFKSWNLRKKFFHNPIFIIGSFHLLKQQQKKLNYKIKLKKIDNIFEINKIKNNDLLVFDVKYRQLKAFEKISYKSSKYILKCFEIAIKLAKQKKIIGFINCPVSKEHLFKKKYQGITEFLSKKSGNNGNEVMLIYNKNLSVAPITTHIPLKMVSRSLNKFIIKKKVVIINDFYKKVFGKKPNLALLGLNPHNYSPYEKSEEKIIINKAIKSLQKDKINVLGPLAPDSSFMNIKKYKLDVIVGMYHDQVLAPYKTLYNFNAINITLGLPYIRISPDHGIGEDLIGKNAANPKSLIECIKFFNNLN